MRVGDCGVATLRRRDGRRGLRIVASLVSTTALACSFQAPGYDGTSFRCDGDELCPSGFECHVGRCVPAGDVEDAGVDLLVNGGCETLASWGGFQADLTSSADARSGAAACLLCLDEGVEYGTLDLFSENGVEDPAIGTIYVASAWMRRAAGSTMIGPGRVNLREYSGGEQGALTSSPSVDLLDDWQRVEVFHEIVADADLLDIYVSWHATGPDCFLVDDVTLFAMP